MEFADIAGALEGIPYMSVEYGRRIYDHVRDNAVDEALELGSAHGVGSAYIAAGLEAAGRGRLTTVDYGMADFDPSPEEVLRKVGLDHRVTVVRANSTYNWFLKERIEERSDGAGNCVPFYDFVYLDGSKNWNFDGLAVFLVEKLLRPGGWLVMDDLGWTYEQHPWALPQPDKWAFAPFSESERTEPHLTAVFELLVKQHPSFRRFLLENEWYGWAQKGVEAVPRQLEITTSRSLQALVTAELRKLKRRWAARDRRRAAAR